MGGKLVVKAECERISPEGESGTEIIIIPPEKDPSFNWYKELPSRVIRKADELSREQYAGSIIEVLSVTISPPGHKSKTVKLEDLKEIDTAFIV